MKLMLVVLAAFAVVLTALTGVASAAPAAPAAKPAIVIKTGNLGKVVATPAKLGIYYWDTEKRAGGKIRCTGGCAAQWPPVFVQGKVARHIAGSKATFGTIKRAGKLQLTVNGLPAYTFVGDSAGVVKCDNVDGWHAVRAR